MQHTTQHSHHSRSTSVFHHLDLRKNGSRNDEISFLGSEDAGRSINNETGKVLAPEGESVKHVGMPVCTWEYGALAAKAR